MFTHDTRLLKALPFLAKPIDNLNDSERLFYSHLEWLIKLPKDFSSILDIGCGPGYHSKYFEITGHTVTACDKNDRFQFKNTIEFIQSTIEELPSNKRYDAIFASHVFEHIINLGNFLDKIKKLLNDDGYLFVIVPCSSVTESGHWLEGWSITQVAMILAAYGFDCKDSFFEQWGYNTAGFGKKKTRPNNDFIVEECLPFLPRKFAELRPDGHPGILYRNVSYVDNKKIIRTIQPWDMVNRYFINKTNINSFLKSAYHKIRNIFKR